jgi:hypothetical protein
MMERAGFTQVEFMGETGVNTSPTTIGVTFKAQKDSSK